MPVLYKTRLSELNKHLSDRYITLKDTLQARELKSSKEGVKGRWCWQFPETLAATIGNDMEIRLAVEDFKAILAEIKKLQ